MNYLRGRARWQTVNWRNVPFHSVAAPPHRPYSSGRAASGTPAGPGEFVEIYVIIYH